MPKDDNDTPQHWTLEPFEPPRGVGEGRYTMLFVGPEGPIAPKPGVPEPTLEVWWISQDEVAEDPERVRKESVWALDIARERQERERAEAELDRVKAQLQVFSSESSALAKMQTLVSEGAAQVSASAHREISTAQKTTEVALGILEAAAHRTKELSAPAAPSAPIDWMAPVTQLVKGATDIGVALAKRDPDRARRALAAAGTPPVAKGLVEGGTNEEPASAETPAAPAGEAATAAPATPAPAAPPAAAAPPSVVEVPVPPPEGTEAFATLIKNLSAEERAELAEALADPARVAEFLTKIRRRPAGVP